MTYLKKFKLDNKKAYVLGGSGTIGFEICNALHEFGAKVINLDKKLNFNLKKNIKQINFDFSNLNKIEDKLNQIFKKRRFARYICKLFICLHKDWKKVRLKK